MRLFPPRPEGLKGRTAELATLARTIEEAAPTRLALVGGGGSGKSLLAAELAHRLSRRFGGRLDWFRVGAWDHRTLLEMLALRWGLPRDRKVVVGALRAHLRKAERLVVLDNHEDDAATATLPACAQATATCCNDASGKASVTTRASTTQTDRIARIGAYSRLTMFARRSVCKCGAVAPRRPMRGWRGHNRCLRHLRPGLRDGGDQFRRVRVDHRRIERDEIDVHQARAGREDHRTLIRGEKPGLA